jgi:murein DD-endopeptidase MepM/ murein hydrolase activator NlpD
LTSASARPIALAMVASLAALMLAAQPAVARVPRPREPGAQAKALASDTNGRVAWAHLPRLPPLVVEPKAVTDTVLVAGRIATNLYAALDSCAATTLPLRARWKLAWSVADILEYRVDMSRDLRVGDTFRVLVERAFNPVDGFHAGPVLAVIFVESRDTLTAIRFRTTDASPTESVANEYYDVHGRSLRAAFLRAPVEFRRISSGFGMRLHPILKVWRAHKGTDYVAPAGTPVRAIGDGTVIFAGQKGGYGNVIDLRHVNGYITRYGHLSRFAAGIHRGTRVSIGKTIAYVGMTGLATAPHLHFEVLVNGVQRDPRVALRDRGSGQPVPSARRSEFDALAQRSMGALRAGPAVGAVAVN